MSAFNEIIEWAKNELPKWQQFIIKDILGGVSFDSERIKGLADIALDDSGLADNLLDDLIPSTSVNRSVCLTSVCELRNINNLKDDSCLSFNTAGLTIIYGQNGTGKSGYSRIIKKCCRSRDKDAEILGNVHNPSDRNQSAKIKYEIDGITAEHNWSKASIAPPELQTIHVFDRSSGEVFLSKEADIQYKPSGMDILDRLAEILPKISEELQSRNNALKITDVSSLFQNEYADTNAAKFIGNLGSSDAQARYSSLAELSEKELTEINDLTRNIPMREATSPAKERENLTKNNKSLQKVRSYFADILNLISMDSINEVNQKINALICANKNAEDAKRLSFERDSFLSGTGNEAWKAMWKAAEKFSKGFAYVGHNYPSETIGAKCVLCQQTIHPEHIDIMKRFGAYVNDESQNILIKCKTALDGARIKLNSTMKSLEDEETLSKTIEDSLPEIYESLVKILSSARELISDIVNSLDDLEHIALEENDLDEYIKKLETYGTLLQNMDKLLETNKLALAKPLDDEEYKSLLDADKMKLSELKARQILKQHKTAIANNIRDLPARRHIENVIKQCGTRGISFKTTELSNKYIIASLSDFFNSELTQIVGNRVKSTLIPVGTRSGVPYSRIVLQLKDGQPYSGKLVDVLSEGEFRGVSLAGFFAELAMTENMSAIVFDDPVSSLDHINAGRIADRIASEVGKRQIIVFTHDILFVSYLMDRVDQKMISYITLESLGQAGIVSDGLPFDKLTVSGRISALRNLLQSKIRPAYRNNQAEDYTRLAGTFYKDLRLSWERAVEEILFGDVVKRYSHNVSTQLLKYVRFTDNNASVVAQNMTLCSNYLLHDPASVESINYGTPDDLEGHLKVLDDFNRNNPRQERKIEQSINPNSPPNIEKRFSF